MRPRTVELTLSGNPVPKARPRFTKTGRVYTDDNTRAAEKALVTTWITATGNLPPHDGPVTLEVVATFTPAKTWPKWKHYMASIGDYPHLSRPDLDNLVKLIKDGLNGRAWLDDSQVTEILGSKRYGNRASTRIVVTFHPAPPTHNPK